MEGWRARIGLVIPAVNAVMERDFNRLAPEGVAVFASRMGRTSPELSADSMREMLIHLDLASLLVSQVGLDLIVFGCTTGSIVRGAGGDLEIANSVRESTGVPAITSSTAVRFALKALGIHRVTIVSPSPEELNEMTARFYVDNGFDVAGISGPQFDTSWQRGAYPTEEIYRYARSAFVPDSDGLYISCTTFRALGAIAPLERDLGKPVVTANQASLWYAMKTLGIRESLQGYGRLLEAF